MQLAQVDWKQRVNLVNLKKICTQYLTKLQTQLHYKPYEIIVDYKWRQTIHQIYSFISCYKKFWTEQTIFALQTFDFYLQYEKKYYLKLLLIQLKTGCMNIRIITVLKNPASRLMEISWPIKIKI